MNNQQTLSILDAHYFSDVAAVDDFCRRCSFRDVVNLAEGIAHSIRDSAQPVQQSSAQSGIDKANFLPSSSFRGSSGCELWDCRSRKVHLLARYAALYCDNVIVPVDFEGACQETRDAFHPMTRASIASRLSEIVALRPLIETGIVALVPEKLYFCEAHWQEAVPEHQRILKTAEKLARANVGKFTVSYEPQMVEGHHAGMLNFRGPEDYLEHGQMSRFISPPPSWLPKRLSSGKIQLSRELIRKKRVVVPLFQDIANDALLHAYFGPLFNARYVTDNGGEAEFFQVLNARDRLGMRSAELCARLTHVVPMFQDVPLHAVLKLRRDEPEAFESYRSTLTKIVRDHVRDGKGVSSSEAKDIYLDLLKPELNALETTAKNLRRARMKESVLKVAAASTVVGLAVYGGLPSTQLLDFIKTVGGISVAKDLAEILGALQKNPTAVRNHNLYFMLRVKQAKHSHND